MVTSMSFSVAPAETAHGRAAHQQIAQQTQRAKEGERKARNRTGNVGRDFVAVGLLHNVHGESAHQLRAGAGDDAAARHAEGHQRRAAAEEV